MKNNRKNRNIAFIREKNKLRKSFTLKDYVNELFSLSSEKINNIMATGKYSYVKDKTYLRNIK